MERTVIHTLGVRWSRTVFGAGLTLASLLILVLAGCGDGDPNFAAPTSASWTVDAGAVKLKIQETPWQMAFHDAAGAPLLLESTATGTGPVGALGLNLGPPPEGSGQVPALTPVKAGIPAAPPSRDQGWVRATQMIQSENSADRWMATLATTSPAYQIRVSAHAAGEGVISVTAEAVPPDGVQAIGIAFSSDSQERLFGFGERSNGVNQAGNTLEHYVGEGPYQNNEYSLITAFVPKWGIRWRKDATYFPIPWLLSSRGYGVLLDNDELSYHRLRSDDPGAWSMEVEATALRFRVFGGPTPAAALQRYTAAVGRQLANPLPWFFGPWLEPDTDERIGQFLAADVPTSVTATFVHYLPCGAQQGHEQEQIDRTAALNAKGTAVLTYFNPMICTNYPPPFATAEAAGVLIKNRQGQTYIFPYTTSTVFTVSQFDFAASQAVAVYKTLTDEAIGHGYEGWMEDFGEYTPLDAIAADGSTGTRYHNRYPRDYHCSVQQANAAGEPLARYVRSGWTGSAACVPLVWGGDPTTAFGFDGLESSIYQALSIGTSGVGLWGSDIGGFFALGSTHLTDELLDRWIAFGALSVIMRNQLNGIAIPAKSRPQPWDPAHLPVWRKFAKLHTQLYPYIRAAVDVYYATGMPIMRHNVLTHPDDPQAVARDDQYMFGPDLLVAPVFEAGATVRELYLPAGRWVDFWQSIHYEETTGAFSIKNPAVILEGGRSVTVPAPVGEIPLFVRAGAQIPMLPPDVFTLAEHGTDPTIVHLSDRINQTRLLSFPD
jgi:alpha-glucosidase